MNPRMHASARARPSRRRLTNLLVDARLQLHHAVQMVAVSGGLTLAFGALVYHFHAEASRVVNVRALDPADGTAQALQAEFARSGHALVLSLVAFGLLLSGALALWQIATTHRIAGPLYYLGHQLRRVRDGKLGLLHPLRRGDLLHDFFERFREMHDALRARAMGDAVRFARLADDAERAGLLHVANELRALQHERERSLE